VAGVVVFLLGVVMALPGIGAGCWMIIGVTLLDFPASARSSAACSGTARPARHQPAARRFHRPPLEVK
jgi:hypothetical protein